MLMTPPATARRQVWQIIRDVGPLPVAGIAQRSGLPESEAARACGELHATRFLQRNAGRDGLMRYEVTARAFDEGACQRALERIEREPPPAPQREQPTPPAVDRQCRKSQRQAIYQHMHRRGDATRDELAAALGIDLSSVCPRIDELLKAKVVRETKRKRKTRRGKMAGVLELTGQALLF